VYETFFSLICAASAMLKGSENEGEEAGAVSESDLLLFNLIKLFILQIETETMCNYIMDVVVACIHASSL
jgi:hypothetical protein